MKRKNYWTTYSTYNIAKILKSFKKNKWNKYLIVVIKKMLYKQIGLKENWGFSSIELASFKILDRIQTEAFQAFLKRALVNILGINLMLMIVF